MVADFDTRLAEFDRKLREIQADLVPGGGATPEPAPAPVVSVPPEPEPARESLAERDPGPAAERDPGPDPDPEPAPPHTTGREGPLAELLQHSHPEPPPPAPALEGLGELLSSLHEVLHGIERALARASTRETTIAAGPFASIDEVREFERRLASVPGVREVTIRGYEGAARAIIDVELDQ